MSQRPAPPGIGATSTLFIKGSYGGASGFPLDGATAEDGYSLYLFVELWHRVRRRLPSKGCSEGAV